LPEYSQGWFVPESNIHTRQHWFWSPNTDKTLKSPERMMEAYNSSVALGANLLVNMTPDTDGLIPAAEVDMLETFGAALDARFAVSKKGTWKQKAQHKNNQFLLKLYASTPITDIVLEEDLEYGQHIESYTIEAKVNKEWVEIAQGKSIGRKRIHAIDGVEAKRLRLTIIESSGTPRIRAFKVY
jgi:alpha-L-fucosidase